MPAFADIAINNGVGALTTFGMYRPYGGDTTPAVWIDRSATTALGFRRIECGMRRANGSNSYKVPLKVTMPVTAVVNGATVVTHTLLFDGVFTLPDASTEDQRKDLAAFVMNSIAHGQVYDFIRRLTPAA